MSPVAFYMLLLLFCGAVAWFFSGFPAVRRLDDRLFSLVHRMTANFRRKSNAA